MLSRIPHRPCHRAKVYMEVSNNQGLPIWTQNKWSFYIRTPKQDPQLLSTLLRQQSAAVVIVRSSWGPGDAAALRNSEDGFRSSLVVVVTNMSKNDNNRNKK